MGFIYTRQCQVTSKDPHEMSIRSCCDGLTGL